MTHDEMLDLVQKAYDIDALYIQYKALRAVVELHKPEAQEHEQYEKCWNCNLVYPCPTINAIEKELG